MTDKLSHIEVSTMVLVGQEDPALPAAQLTHERIANSKLVTIPGAGHLSNLDQPELFNQEVMRFLEEVDAQRETKPPDAAFHRR